MHRVMERNQRAAFSDNETKKKKQMRVNTDRGVVSATRRMPKRVLNIRRCVGVAG
jgi:hypothetical protein